MPVGAAQMCRWEQYGAKLPFGSMWYSVPPAASTPRDQHPDTELSVVVQGTATVEAGGRLTDVSAGSAFLLDAAEPHIVHNRSRDEELVVFSAYWISHV